MAQFGVPHLATLVLLIVVGVPIARRGSPRWIAVGLLVAQLLDPWIAWRTGTLSWQRSLPLELCDAACFALIAALLARRAFAFELAYFWGLSATSQALLFPDIAADAPAPELVRFFALHGGIVAGVLRLCREMEPRPRAAARVFGATVVYAAVLLPLNLLLDANYMYLVRPPGASVLSLFGPWPWYLLGGAAVGAALFALLALPYSLRRRRSASIR